MGQGFGFDARDYAFTEYIDAQNFIGGSWQPAASGESIEVINPRHGRAMGRVSISGAADVQAAVEAAQEAFAAWRAVPIRERAEILLKFKHLAEENLDELAWLLSHENGKTLAQARGDVLKGLECTMMGASCSMMADGGNLDVSRGVNCRVVHEPVGIVAGVAPFNFPTMVPLWMIPQALVAGNCMVFKPSEKVPYGCVRIAELLQRAGLPDGVFNVVQGSRAAVEAIVDHADIKAVGFVGSTRVAKALYARGTALGKKMLCLGGAKNHLVVVPDADLELTVDNVTASYTGCSGQRCMAAAVLVAVGDVQPIIDGIVERSRGIELGKDMGSIVTVESKERIEGYIAQAQEDGCEILLDGRGASVEGAPGYWVGPTVIDNVRPDQSVACEEIFGPVLSIIRVDSLEEAIAIENANPYGNAASIYTTSGGVAEEAVRRFEAGMVGINIGVPVPREPFAFGGWNDSKFGEGDITGWDGFRFWTRPRKITTKWALARDNSWMS